MRLEAALFAVQTQANHSVIQLAHPWLPVFAQVLHGHAALIVGLQDSTTDFIDGGTGFSVEIGQGDGALRHFVRIRSHELAVHPAFVSLCGHLLRVSAEADSAQSSANNFLLSLEEFRNFLAKPKKRLGEDAVRGLMAELLLLSRLSDLGLPLGDVLQAWHGPYRGAKDFIFPTGHCIEVKSARIPPARVTISSAEQLASPFGSLQLLIVPLDRVLVRTQTSTSFLAFLYELGVRFGVQNNSAALWGAALDAIGIDLNDPYYATWHFEVGTESVYNVNEGFPKIVPASLDDGINQVQYQIDIARIQEFSSELSLEQVTNG